MRWLVRRLVRPVLGPAVPFRVQRLWLELVTRPTPLARGVEIRRGMLAGRPAEEAVPGGAGSDHAVLYLHGGGFTVGSPATHRALATHLAAAIGSRVHVLDYRLAPEHPHPAALDDVPAACRELTRRYERLALVGDSAGGWLALTAALRLRDDGGQLPAAIGLISPWLDLAGRSWAGGPVDAMLRPSWLRRCAAAYAPGADLRDPRFAPLAADLTGLPPVIVQVGRAELLLDDAVRLARRLRSAGTPVDLQGFEEFWHVAQASAGLVTAATEAVGMLAAALLPRLAASDRR
jgi:acetyl esterase/lipase